MYGDSPEFWLGNAEERKKVTKHSLVIQHELTARDYGGMVIGEEGVVVGGGEGGCQTFSFRTADYCNTYDVHTCAQDVYLCQAQTVLCSIDT